MTNLFPESYSQSWYQDFLSNCVHLFLEVSNICMGIGKIQYSINYNSLELKIKWHLQSITHCGVDTDEQPNILFVSLYLQLI